VARGWESKAVEDQIASAENKPAPGRPLTSAERELRARRDTLLLARAKVLADLANARDGRHRVMLEESLKFLDAEISRSPHHPDDR